jgi:DNA-binding beta-propeller fold protein YncE
MTDASPDLYPNAGSDGRTESTPRGLSRRHLLTGSAAMGAAVTAGCLGSEAEDQNEDGDPEPTDEATVFVFNTGDGTVTLVDPDVDEVVETRSLGLTASFPSNQFSPRLIESPGDSLWLNVGEGVRAVRAGSLTERARFDTGSGANWQERTPDGAHLVVSAREPTHTQFRIDADPDSETFGGVTGEIDRTPEGGRGDNDGPGPCDVTVHPDGEYAYVPDLFGDTLTVIDIEAFEIETQVGVEPVDGVPPEPWMGTAAWDGDRLLVEHNDGDAGSESIWDVSDPAEPVERVRLTPDDGLGEGPLTSEVGPDSEFGYVFTPGTNDVSVVDLVAEAVETRLDLGGEAFTGTWGPERERLYVPVQTADEVAVVDSAAREVVETLEAGPEPYGATAATVRPAPSTGANESLSRLAALTGDYETTYCIGRCGCGHEM